jgi:hypothetical protein
MGDFNEDLETSSATMGLIDLMQVKIGHQNFLTHNDGQSRIDLYLGHLEWSEHALMRGMNRFGTDLRRIIAVSFWILIMLFCSAIKQQ